MQEDPIADDDLIEIRTINENKDIDFDEDDGVDQLLTAKLIREDLKFANLELHFLALDSNMDPALQIQRTLKSCVAGYQELSKHLEKKLKI